MLRHSTFAAVLWALAVVLLPIRMANAHLHFCLDGKSQPVSVHVKDIATHVGTEHGADEGHDDRDVDFSASLQAVKWSNGGDTAPLALLHVYVLAILLPVEPHFVPESPLLEHDLTSVLDLRPPVRGPPA